MRLISQEGLPEPVNVPYDRVTVRIQIESFTIDGPGRRRIIAVDGINIYTLGLYTNLDEAETVFEAIISAGRMDKNVFELPKDHYSEGPLPLIPSR